MTCCVVLATYNGEKYVRALLESIAGQTQAPSSVVIFDDASGDATCQIVRDFAKGRANWFLTERKENVGYRRNFFEALQAVEADVYFLCDQDDVWMPHKIEAFMKVFSTHSDAQAVLSDYVLVDCALEPLAGAKGADFGAGAGVRKVGRLHSDVLAWAHGGIAPGCCMAVTRALRDAFVAVSDNKMPHDWEMSVIADSRDGLYALPEPLTQYRQHESNEIGMATRPLPLKMRGTQAARMRVHEAFEGLCHVLRSCAAGQVDDALLARMERYAVARRAFLEAPSLGRLWPVYKEYAVYRRAIVLRGRLGDLKIALTR